jgi:hypothetical protein
MDDSWLACELVFYVFRLNQKDLELLAIANEQYIRGFRRGQKSSQFTPIAPTDSNI